MICFAECERGDEKLLSTLRSHSLGFLVPMLEIGADLWQQINADPSPANLFRWIMKNVDSKYQHENGFTRALFSVYVILLMSGLQTAQTDMVISLIIDLSCGFLTMEKFHSDCCTVYKRVDNSV